MLKRATVTNITHYEYCFDNDLKNKRARELIKMYTELAILDLRGEKLNYKSVAKEISKPPFFGS